MLSLCSSAISRALSTRPLLTRFLATSFILTSKIIFVNLLNSVVIKLEVSGIIF